MRLLALNSQDPEYRRVYACFKRAHESKKTPAAVASAFTAKNQNLLKEWLADGRTFDGMVLRLRQQRTEIAEQWGFRTPLGQNAPL
jgi:hypothetical protein